MGVGAQHRQVDGELVVVARAVGGLVELDQLVGRRGVVVVDPVGECLAQLDPGLLVVAGLEKDVGPLVGTDDATGGVAEQLVLVE